MNNDKAQQIRNLIKKKKSNLCLSLDIPEWNKFFSVLKSVADKIILLKVHLDIMENLNVENLSYLHELKYKYNFFIWEDRKLCDIGHTNTLIINKLLSYKYAVYTIKNNLNKIIYTNLIDYISILPIGGELSLSSLLHLDIGIFLLCQMSSQGNLFNNNLTHNILQLPKIYNNQIAGIINQDINISNIPYPMLSIIPGLNNKNYTYDTHNIDSMGQRYRNINKLKHQPDIYVIGRNIYQSDNPRETVINLIQQINELQN